MDWNTLISDYGPKVSSLCLKMLHDPDLAQDAAQNIWLLVIEKIDQFENRSQISTWIYTISSRECLRILKTVRDRYNYTKLLYEYHNYPPKVPDLSPKDFRNWVKGECDVCLTGVVYSLNPEERLAFLLRYLIDFSYLQISEILEKSEDSTRQYVHRAKKKFMEFVENECAYFQPGAVCRCGLSDPVSRAELNTEFYHTVHMFEAMNFLKAWDQVFPAKNWWLK